MTLKEFRQTAVLDRNERPETAPESLQRLAVSACLAPITPSRHRSVGRAPTAPGSGTPSRYRSVANASAADLGFSATSGALHPGRWAGGGAQGPAGCRIEVCLRPGFLDAAGTAVRAQLPLIGIQSVGEVRVAILYEFYGRLPVAQAVTAAQELLADPITQEFHVNGHVHGGKASNSQSRPHWRIEVWNKPGVLDSAGETVRKAMADLGLPVPEAVRCGAAYKLFGRLSRSQAEKIAVKLLANTVIHRYTVAPC